MRLIKNSYFSKKSEIDLLALRPLISEEISDLEFSCKLFKSLFRELLSYYNEEENLQKKINLSQEYLENDKFIQNQINKFMSIIDKDLSYNETFDISNLWFLPGYVDLIESQETFNEALDLIKELNLNLRDINNLYHKKIEKAIKDKEENKAEEVYPKEIYLEHGQEEEENDLFLPNLNNLLPPGQTQKLVKKIKEITHGDESKLMFLSILDTMPDFMAFMIKELNFNYKFLFNLTYWPEIALLANLWKKNSSLLNQPFSISLFRFEEGGRVSDLLAQKSLDAKKFFENFNLILQLPEINDVAKKINKQVFEKISLAKLMSEISFEEIQKIFKLSAKPNYNFSCIISSFDDKLKENQFNEAKEKFIKYFLNNLNFNNKESFIKKFVNFPGIDNVFRRYDKLIEPICKFINFFMKEWGKDVNFAEKMAEMICFNIFLLNMDDKITQEILSMIYDKKIPANNPEQLFNVLKQGCFIEKKIDDLYNTGSLDPESVETLEDIIITFISNKYDINNDTLIKAIDLALDDSITEIKDFRQKCEYFNFNPDEIKNSIFQIKNQFANHRLNLNKNFIYDLDNKINLIQSYDCVQEYKQYKKPKDKRLYNLNYTINDDLKFEVLPENSTEYFTVGSATECCQRIRRPGAVACADSYINPLAGVVLLRYQNKYIISQSYFHYVPEDNGYILDNVEANLSLIKSLNLNIDALYASLAAQVKKDYDVNYFRCGMAHNKLSSSAFGVEESGPDKRKFEVEEIGLEIPTSKNTSSSSRYTDYKEECLDLLSTTITTTELIKNSLDKISSLSKYFLSLILQKIG